LTLREEIYGTGRKSYHLEELHHGIRICALRIGEASNLPEKLVEELDHLVD